MRMTSRKIRTNNLLLILTFSLLCLAESQNLTSAIGGEGGSRSQKLRECPDDILVATIKSTNNNDNVLISGKRNEYFDMVQFFDQIKKLRYIFTHHLCTSIVFRMLAVSVFQIVR